MKYGLAIIAVRLTVQLVEHVCHCDDASADVLKVQIWNERGAQLIVGKCVAATRLLGLLGG